MNCWEYKIAASVDDIHMIGALDKLGADGWELVGFDGRGIAFFKRPLPKPPVVVQPAGTPAKK